MALYFDDNNIPHGNMLYVDYLYNPLIDIND